MQETIELYGDGVGKVQYIDHMGDDKRVVNAARVSFGQDSVEPMLPKDEKLLRYLMKHQHTSPFEHCQITWKFTVPLFVRSQHHRHRTWSYNEISRRYTSEDLRFYLPKTFRTQHSKDRQASNEDESNPFFKTYGSDLIEKHASAKKHLLLSTEHCFVVYECMLQSDICREQARMVLPQNMYTEYYGSTNLLNAMKFIKLRIDSHAQKEIQVVAEAMLTHLQELFPVTMTAFDELVLDK